jgi:hypothetical protein
MTEKFDEYGNLKSLIARFNTLSRQRSGLQDRVDKLTARMDAVQSQIDAEDMRLNGPRW